jgi:hypothetical protein
MSVQMIELEELSLVEVSDAALEAIGGGIFTGSVDLVSLEGC